MQGVQDHKLQHGLLSLMVHPFILFFGGIAQLSADVRVHPRLLPTVKLFFCKIPRTHPKTALSPPRYSPVQFDLGALISTN